MEIPSQATEGAIINVPSINKQARYSFQNLFSDGLEGQGEPQRVYRIPLQDSMAAVDGVIT